MQKRIFSLLMAAVLLLALAAPASAAAKAKEHCKGTPLIVVQGFNSVPLRQGEDVYFIATDAASILKLVATAVVPLVTALPKVVLTEQPEALAEALMPAIRMFFGPLGWDVNQKPSGDGIALEAESFPKSLDHYGADELELATGLADYVAEECGMDHVYLYTYDWRRDVYDLAKGLKDMIAAVKKETGHSTVNLAAVSMGGAVTNAYLSAYGEKNNFADLGNVVYLSPAWQGTSMAGAMLTGEMELNLKSFIELMMFLQGEEPVVPQWVIELALLPLVNVGGVDYLNEVIQVLVDTYLRDLIKHWAGLWVLCPQEDYQAARAACFPGGGTKEEQALVKSLDKYFALQANVDKTIKKLQKAGHGFAVVSMYTQPLNAPISDVKHTLWSDGTIDTYFTGGFPTLAAFPDGQLSGQKVKDGHDHLSPDRVVDASTCLFPENTWFIRNGTHSVYQVNEWPAKLAYWLVKGGSLGTVHSNKNYPQFSVYEPGNEKSGSFN